MTDEELFAFLRSLLDLKALDPRESEWQERAKALIEVKDAGVTHLKACVWASAHPQPALWSFAEASPCNDCPFIGAMDYSIEELYIWVREEYCGCLDAETVRSCVLALVREAFSVDPGMVQELFRLTNPNVEVPGLEDIHDVLARDLKNLMITARRAAARRAGVREDDLEQML